MTAPLHQHDADPALDRLLDQALAPQAPRPGFEDRLLLAIRHAQAQQEPLTQTPAVLGRIGFGSTLKQAAIAASILLTAATALWWRPVTIDPITTDPLAVETRLSAQLSLWADAAEQLDSPRDDIDLTLAEVASQITFAHAANALSEDTDWQSQPNDELDDSINLLLNQWDTTVF